MMNSTAAATSAAQAAASLPASFPALEAPQWMHDFVSFRQRLFLQTVEPIIVALLGPVEDDQQQQQNHSLHDSQSFYAPQPQLGSLEYPTDDITDFEALNHRRLNFLPSYIKDVEAFHETSMSFATLIMLFSTLLAVFFIFLSCFYHNQKTSPLFVSPRRHRLPKLVPPPLPVDGYLAWAKVCFYLSDEEIIHRIGYDALIFLRFHRLALRCIVKMSVFSFLVILPINFTGGGHANAQDLKEYVGTLFFTDFLRFTMANVTPGSLKLWVHCLGIYLLTGIVVRELLIEYETFNSIRHRYLLSREPHLRTVLVTNIPRNLRSNRKITNYFKHVYPDAVKSVLLCQNLIELEKLVEKRTKVLSKIENELLLLCRSEKKKLYEQYSNVCCCCCPGEETSSNAPVSANVLSWQLCCECWRGGVDSTQERLATLYSQLEELNQAVFQEQRRRKRVMKMLDRMEAGEGVKDIDYVLATPFVTTPTGQGLGAAESSNQHAKTQQYQQTIGGTKGGERYLPPDVQHTSIPEEEHEDSYHSSSSQQETQTESTMSAPARSTDNNSLRSRSPSNPASGNSRDTSGIADTVDNNDDKDNKKKHPFSKAKHAIRRYSRVNREVTFLGRPVRSGVNASDPIAASIADVGPMEPHLNEVTDKAFVVMRTYTAATIAIQSMHSSKPGSMQVSTAPEPRDILWDNIYVSKGAQRTRSYIGEFVVTLIICFYIVPIATVALLVSESALVSSSPRLAQLDRASPIFSVAIAMVQPICIVSLQQLLPPLFVAIGQAEGRTSFSEVQMQTFSRYFFFQVLNVFLVTTIAGTIFDTIAIIIEKPESALVMLGNSLPRMSSFFITFVIMKTFLGLGVELVRIVALFQGIGRFGISPNTTLREKRKVMVGMRAMDDPGWFPFHKILAQDMLVVVISVVFAVVAPLVLLPCAMFCLCSRILWTHQHLYVYESCFESGGQFWPKIFRRFVFGLIIAQMTITGQFILKEARHQAYATVALMFMTYFFLRSTRARYDPTSSTLPLEVSTVMDITLQQEDEIRKKDAEAKGNKDLTNSTNETQTMDDDDDEPGRYIGRYDPFRKAYLQPALRANPKARPEQPFPPAQLGSEETFFSGEDDGSDGVQDSSGSVRVKSLNQPERRLINRWWNDQLQRAGPQNTFMVLCGEECGTLTLSHNEDARPSLVENHSFV